MTFGMWWIYFVLPCADVLHEHRERGFGWGYGHIVVFGAVAAVGAGLHAAAYYIEHHSVLAATGTVLTVAVPLARLHRRPSTPCTASSPARSTRSTSLLIALSAVIVGGSVLMAVAGVPLVWCLLVLSTGAVGDGGGLRDDRPPAQRAGAGPRTRGGRGPLTGVAVRLAGSRTCAHGGSTSSAIRTTS